MRDIVVPLDFGKWKLSNPTPREQLDYFRSHIGNVKLPINMWNTFYCESTEHPGFCCGSCLSDEDYLGQPNFDDRCCCLSEGATHE